MLAFRLGLLFALTLAGACPATASAGVRADRDRDKVFESLEARLGGTVSRPVLVALRVPATAARLERIERAVGDLGTPTRLRLVDAFAARATPAQVRALARRADVVHVEDDGRAVPFAVGVQEAFGVARARESLPGLDGRGRVAAVIDTGIDPQMPDLAGKVVAFKDFVNGATTPYDDVGHGSLVAGLLAGSGASGPEGRGVASAASLVSIKVINSAGQSSLGLIAQAIQWAVEHRAQYGIDAINLSIGDPAGCSDGNDVASQAVDAAVAAGIVVVTAAGNSGPALCTIKAPAAARSALTVGAMAGPGSGGFSGAWFSSRGPTADGRVKPDIAGPGVGVVMADPAGGTTEGYGTSVTAAFVTGTALLLRQVDPGLAPGVLKDLVKRTAVDWGVPGADNEYGAGRLDVYAALAAAGAALATPPALPAHRAWTGSLGASESVAYDIDVAGPRFPLAATLSAPGAGWTVTLRDPSGAVVGQTTGQPSSSRHVDLSLAAPAAGRYSLTVTSGSYTGAFALDASGSLAPADADAPALTLDTVTASAVGGAAGSGFGDFDGVVVRVLAGSDVVLRARAVPLLGRWTLPLSLADGTYTVVAEQGDAAGNVTNTAPRTLVVATPPPAPTLTPSPTPPPVSTPAPPAPTATPSAPAPRIALTVRRQRLTAVLRGGLSVKVGCSCRVTVTVKQGKRTLARRTLSGTARLKLSRRPRSGPLTIIASARGAPTVIRRVVLGR